MQRDIASIEILENTALCRMLRWSSIMASGLSAVWVPLLFSLVFRCKAASHPFPVLAKFAPFQYHFQLTDAMLRTSPLFGLLALVFLAGAWYQSRSGEIVRPAGVALGASLALSVLVAAGNPGGFFGWLLS